MSGEQFVFDILGLVTYSVTIDGNRMVGEKAGFLPQDEFERLESQALQFIGGIRSLQFIGDPLLLEISGRISWFFPLDGLGWRCF